MKSKVIYYCQCGHKIHSTDQIQMRQDRKPGFNPLESVMANPEGFTDPRPCCPKCSAYLVKEKILFSDVPRLARRRRKK